MRNFWYRNKSLDRFSVDVGRINTSPDHNRGLINIQVASTDSPERTRSLAISVLWKEVDSCFRNAKGRSVDEMNYVEAWNTADGVWGNELRKFAKYVVLLDRWATFGDSTILIGSEQASRVPLSVENGNLIFTQGDLLQIEENRIARRLALRIAYEKGHESIRIGEAIGGISLGNMSEEQLSFDKNVFLRAVRVLESAGFLRQEHNDAYFITLTGQLKYEESFASFQDKAFIIASCEPRVRLAIDLYRRVLKDEFGLEGIFQEDVEPAKSIHIDIFEYIQNVPLIIADLTVHRPNCYLELGYAMALNKRIILALNEEDHYDPKTGKELLAFDTTPMKYTFYRDMKELEEKIRERIAVNLEMIRKVAEI